MKSAALKDARIELKTSSSVKAYLQKAAQISGQDLTSFVLASAEARTREVMEQYSRLTLKSEAHGALLDALMSPAKPTNGLRDLMADEPLVRR
ncbi:DUF1778 domain-containing protein [uncultured Zhongshania sp.]|jgi:uncharacterized protein (DUF1778 family)|uniref:type II toxin-antitoxin system TacA family antitoxin n=1 Tax=uncultured Zhongshania sp. TaxID=1642288 RepID=UPI001B3E35FE|nr:DUF1778 domain-containing protein [uncultured Zhongshania sp.]MBQ0758788.1 DUF1778 domain-containing protein [Zhongshania sp.]|tara:strand:+ start:47 stop:325 length:279 start_codon:yes stop_codon:yes gene_type:complete